MMPALRCFVVLVVLISVAASPSVSPTSATAGEVNRPRGEFQLATFQADVTIPLGHRCMGILPQKAARILDPLEARGFVLLGDDAPLVLVAIDWCEIRNGAYDQWRDALAEAAGTTRERVLVTSIHQHDAPVVDLEAQQLLTDVGLADELYDVDFHRHVLERVGAAVREALTDVRPVTHLGLGQGRAEQLASNRRVVHPDGRVDFDRYSNGGGDEFLREAPEGEIDPWVKTLTFYDGDRPLLSLHAYAIHPMSYYGQGDVSADFVGMARRWMQRDLPDVMQIYVSGCSGDVVAGKYNDGTPANRPVLADRLYQAMKQSWQSTKKQPLDQVHFRRAALDLPFHEGDEFTAEHLSATLHDAEASMRDRILAAMGLSSRRRIDAGQPIDLPCLDLGTAQIVLLPGEAFVGYQLMAQRLREDSFVMAIGYGECWPGYIPTRQAFDEGFGHSWRWVAPGAADATERALQEVLLSEDADTRRRE